MKKVLFFIVGIVLPSTIAFSQPARSAAPLSTGDPVPDVLFTSINDRDKQPLNFASLKGKAIILDFWDSHCIPCIAAFPKMDSLQEQFKDSLQILLVNTTEEAPEISRFLGKRAAITGKGIRLPVVMADSTLDQLFPHAGVPHEVWINKSGVFIAATGAESVTAENIHGMFRQRFVASGTSNRAYDASRLLVEQLSGDSLSSMMHYSIVMKGMKNVSASSGFELNQAHGSRYFAINFPIRDLYAQAYSPQGYIFPHGLIELHVKDTTAYTAKSNNAFVPAHLYSYEELLAPADRPTTWEHLMDGFRQDLQRNFGLTARVCRKRKHCLALKAADTSRLKSSGAAQYLDKDPFGIDMRNLPMETLTASLNYFFPDQFVVDETNFKGQFDLLIKADLHDLRSINQSLLSYGLSLVPAIRKRDVLVLSEKN